ncbi:hypothetical protein Pedsa_3834 [Pseudopedobacter saltans DSM 12145]|uniref:Uncharacterized protein n=1 Tax=Pseudopedobacter saltans (strain ATCC 51119 / DSM 12145 / JCM 21818 / CCUG 39354 / LMG 10337 / NBRC 100064 / NCIMB 13643) TaxID=762903 RepID=F0S789_PSESL|nr:hypothetical protein [Pseudopedobacter saltans]ADY54362.1 hypothetical protein Pedsa_3834 [Pseudopedobacter saltans DSM 12145]
MKNTFVIILICLLISSCCSKDEERDCIYDIELLTTDVSVTSSGTVNTPLTFKVKLSYHNGCGNFSRFNEKRTENTIEVIAKGQNRGCVCTQAFISFEEDYVFVPKQAGTYNFKFKSAKDTFIEKQVVVN